MAATTVVNRLSEESSPYLRQHAHNPVDWYPWGEEALRRARDEDRPIFLSIGYAACHWCHVMERESFTDPRIAQLMNDHFVNIKVDREERPDLDHLYMSATQLLTGSGGWPLSVWLTPDLKPFYAGTYYPPEDRFGRPGFATVLTEMARAFRERRADVEAQADRVAEALRQLTTVTPPAVAGELDRAPLQAATTALRRQFDATHGGFGGAPKFPSAGALLLLLRQYEHTHDPTLLQMVTQTLVAMAQGGIYDQIGGGFHRYATDARWLVPHFEKMLPDQALLVPAYLEAHRVTGDDLYRRIAEETLRWVQREMTHPEGGFYSSLDADSDGEEGRFYVWTPDEVTTVLGRDDGALFSRIYGITPQGNFEGRSIPHLRRSVAEWAAELGQDAADLQARLDALRERLREARAQRVWPARDDKILTDWNGLMLSAFARAADLLGQLDLRETAVRAATFLLDHLRRDGHLWHSFRAGQATVPAFLADYAFLANGLLDLHALTGEQHWRDAARDLADQMIDLFWDDAGVGFFMTARDQQTPITRSKNPYDEGWPAGNSVAVAVLVRLAALGDNGAREQQARRTLQALRPLMERAPDGFPYLLAALDTYLDLQIETVVPLPEVVRAEARLPDGAVRPGEPVRLLVRLHIEPGWHINAPEPLVPNRIPTVVRITPERDLTVLAVPYPPPGVTGGQLVYEGDVEILADLKADADAPAGDSHLALQVRYQPCGTDRCLAPTETHLTVPVRFERE